MKQLKQPDFPGLVIIQPDKYNDTRGSFSEIFNYDAFCISNLEASFVQDNISISKKNILRGLHFQNTPNEQGKLITVIKGVVRDVAVDIRENSSCFGKHFSIELSDQNNTQLWIPPGFAHGFVSLEDDTIVLYKCDNYYNKKSEGGIIWNDPDLNIDWGIESPILSEKDKTLPSFKELQTLF